MDASPHRFDRRPRHRVGPLLMAWPFSRTVAEADAPAPTQVDSLSEQLRQEQESNLILQEQLVELTADERGWRRMGVTVGNQLVTRQGLTQISARAWLYYAALPLIRRAVRLKTYYVWGQGVTITARDEKIQTLIQAMIDDEGNQAVLFSNEAHAERERELELEGNVFLTLFTSPTNGRVRIRRIPPSQITDIISNPDDDTERWYYRREWTQQQFNTESGTFLSSVRFAYYPDFRFQPPTAQRPKKIAGVDVQWDSPIRHVRSDSLGESPWGFPEVYAALDWARAYKEFLEDWASIAKALSRFAWNTRTKTGQVSKVRQAIDQNRASTAPAGAANVSDGSVVMEPIPKTGAVIDADSGRPLAMMVGAALDLPYTLLMGDADLGNLATAKTLDRPTELAMQNRRSLWESVIRSILDYGVEAAVKTPRGPVSGRWEQDGNRQVITLPESVDSTISVDWPSILEHDVNQMIVAISTAYETGTIDPETAARLLLSALGVSDIDEIIDACRDTDGTFIPPRELAHLAALHQARIDPPPAGTEPDPTIAPPPEEGAADAAAGN